VEVMAATETLHSAAQLLLSTVMGSALCKVSVAAITSTVANIHIPSINVVEMAAFIGRVQVIQATFVTMFQCSQSPHGHVSFRNGASRIRSMAFQNLSIRCVITQAIILMTEALETSRWMKCSNDDCS
jgi:hypothetical protein